MYCLGLVKLIQCSCWLLILDAHKSKALKADEQWHFRIMLYMFNRLMRPLHSHGNICNIEDSSYLLFPVYYQVYQCWVGIIISVHSTFEMWNWKLYVRRTVASAYIKIHGFCYLISVREQWFCFVDTLSIQIHDTG